MREAGKRILFLLMGLAITLFASPELSFAQFNGNNTRGDYGLQAATQPPPGWYLVAPMYVHYHADVFKNATAILSFRMSGTPST